MGKEPGKCREHCPGTSHPAAGLWTPLQGARCTWQLVDGRGQTLEDDCIIYDRYLFSDVQIFTFLSFLLQTV